MKLRHKIIRAYLLEMSPERALDYLHSFHLPKDEELYIIEREINRKSIVKIADDHNTSERAVGEARKRAFGKIADAIDFRNEKSRG